jgi:hypothetical protein
MIKKFREYLNESEGTLTQEQKNWLDKCTEGTCRLNPSTGLLDVDGDFRCSGSELKNLLGVRFGRVSGNFYCSINQLTSLEGAPQKVGGSFFCYDNQLISLEGAPQEVGGNFSCMHNKLTSLEGAPQKVGRGFSCYDNRLTSLKGIPFVNGDINIEQNPIWKLISPYWKQIEGMETGSRNLVMQMIGRLENPTAEDIARIIRSVERMNMI